MLIGLAGGFSDDTWTREWDQGAAYAVPAPTLAEPSSRIDGNDTPLVTSDPERSYTLLKSVQLVDDITGDGASDLLLIEPGANTESSYPSERIHLFSPDTLVPLGSTADSERMWEVESTWEHLYAGTNLAVADHDGDGVSDLIVGVGGNNLYGAVYLLPGPLPDGPREQDLDGARFEGEADFWISTDPVVALPDLDGDGLPEIAVAATPGVAILYGGEGWPSRRADVSNGVEGPGATVLRPAGDVDGDGYEDVATTNGCIGCTKPEMALAGLVYKGPISGWRPWDSHDVAMWRATWDSGTFSNSVVGVGDLTGDGKSEIAIGGALAEGGVAGLPAMYLVQGGQCGELDLGEAGKALVSPVEDSGFGELGFWGPVAAFAAGDVDGGGLSDLLVTSRFVYPDEPESALAYVFLAEDLVW